MSTDQTPETAPETAATAELTVEFLAISPVGFGGYYGRGATVEAAKKELKDAGGNLVRYLVVELPPGAEKAHVDAFGGITWTWAEGADMSAQPKEVYRRGVPKPAERSDSESSAA